nr:radical SAM protein [uncultured Methanolobus sp.]
MFEIKELIVEVSNNCNLACKMCGFGQVPNSPERFMDFSTFKKIIDEIGINAQNIRLNGRGESTIHPNFIDFIEYTKKKCPDSQINLFSNLSFNNPRILKSFLKNDVQLFVSIDSTVEEELKEIRVGCNYEWIISNLKQLSSLKRRPFIVFTVMEDNLHRICDIGTFAVENKCNIIYNTVRRDEGIDIFQNKVKENLAQIQKSYLFLHKYFEKHNLNLFFPDQMAGVQIDTNSAQHTYGQQEECPALTSELCILFNGDVTPCNMFNPYLFGNIIDNDIDSILDDEPRRYFVKNHKSYYYCNNCSCLGGTA